MTGGMHIGDTVHGDKFGGDNFIGNKYVYPSVPRDPAPKQARRVVLVLSANPRLTTPLQVGEEQRAIKRAITLARADSRLETRSADSVRRHDLQLALTTHRPTVVHFIGHGSGQEGIVVVNRYGMPQPVPPAVVTELFRVLAGQIRCVVLNACFTDEQAHAIARHIPCVVGMSGRVSDVTAIEFAASFYQAAAAGCTVQGAFDLARNSLTMNGHTQTDIPVLVAASGVADQITITD